MPNLFNYLHRLPQQMPSGAARASPLAQIFHKYTQNNPASSAGGAGHLPFPLRTNPYAGHNFFGSQFGAQSPYQTSPGSASTAARVLNKWGAPGKPAESGKAHRERLAQSMKRELDEIREALENPHTTAQQHNDHLRHAGAGVARLEQEQMRAVKMQLIEADQAGKSGNKDTRLEVLRSVEALEKQISERQELVYHMFRQADQAYGGGIDKSRHNKLGTAFKEQDKQVEEIQKLKSELARGTPMKDLTKHIDNAIKAQDAAATNISKGTVAQVRYGDNKHVDTHPLSEEKMKISNPFSMGSYLLPALAITGVSVLGYGLGLSLMFALF
jgi:hypothetical protein